MRFFAAVLLATVSSLATAWAADQGPVRITVLSDQDDDIYDARAGRGGVDATRMAVADFGGTVLGRPVEVDALNDHNEAPLVPTLAAQAFDAGADLLMDVQNTPIAIAAGKVATERHRMVITTGSAAPALTRDGCSRYVYHYSFDSTAIESTTAAYLAAEPGGKKWVTIVADAGFGRGVIATMQPILAAHGAEIVKSFVVPPASTDLTAVLPEAKALSPDVVAVFNAGAANDEQLAAVQSAAIKAQLTTALLYLSDVDRAKGAYAGVVAAVPWYWNQDGAAREWSDRFAAAHEGLRPTAAQAADYSATTQWLAAAQRAGSTDADAVAKALDGHAFDDMFAHHGEFRASDHAVVHDLLVVKVLAPDEVKEPHGWYQVLQTVPGAEAFTAGSACKMTQ